MLSASSKMIILYGGQGKSTSALETAIFAKLLIFSRTTEIPRSSEAFNSSTRDLSSSGLLCAWRVVSGQHTS